VRLARGDGYRVDVWRRSFRDDADEDVRGVSGEFFSG
jgi:hypothetical protein